MFATAFAGTVMSLMFVMSEIALMTVIFRDGLDTVMSVMFVMFVIALMTVITVIASTL
jgi:hypothetical protein